MQKPLSGLRIGQLSKTGHNNVRPFKVYTAIGDFLSAHLLGKTTVSDRHLKIRSTISEFTSLTPYIDKV